MTSKKIFDEAKTILEDICIDFDEHGYAPTIPSHRDSDLHFSTIYRKEIDKIDKALELGKLYKRYYEINETNSIIEFLKRTDEFELVKTKIKELENDW